jgi:hypothetical protein
MNIYEYVQHPCTTLHLTGRAARLMAEAKFAAGHGSGAAGGFGTAEA